MSWLTAEDLDLLRQEGCPMDGGAGLDPLVAAIDRRWPRHAIFQRRHGAGGPVTSIVSTYADGAGEPMDWYGRGPDRRASLAVAFVAAVRALAAEEKTG